MPLLVLAAALCPPGIEGTLFATLMSVFNGAGVVGTELGAGLTALFGVTETNFDNLAALTLFCSASSLAPLLAIHWLDDVQSPPPADGAHASVDGEPRAAIEAHGGAAGEAGAEGAGAEGVAARASKPVDAAAE
eukprot:2768977-Prymnesium_polylepis.1